VGPRAALKAVEKKSLLSERESNSGSLVVQPRSLSLYRLSRPGTIISIIIIIIINIIIIDFLCSLVACSTVATVEGYNTNDRWIVAR
jgi:hypothetical protein